MPSRRFAAVTAAWAACLLSFASGLAGMPLPVPAPLRLAAAFICSLLLPGAVLAGRLPLVQAAPVWAACSLAVLCVGTIAAVELHLPATAVGWGIVALGAGGLASGRLARAIDPVRRAEDPALTFLAVALGSGVAFVLWGVSGFVNVEPLIEDALHLTVVRKVAENPALALDNLFYVAGNPTTYLYPPYHLLLALIARGSMLDPVAVYAEVRPLMFALTGATLAATVSLLRPARGAVALSWVLASLLVLTNTGGQLAVHHRDDWAWCAQLAPLSHPADFGLSLMLPIMLFTAARYLLGTGGIAPVVCILGAGLLIHTRETLQALTLLGFLGTAVVVFRRRDRALLVRLAILFAVTIAMGLTYKAVHSARSAEVVAWEAGGRAAVLAAIAEPLHKPLDWLMPKDPQDPLLFRPLYFVPVCLSPFLLIRRDFWALLTGSALAGAVALMGIPLVSWLYVRFTYSEMLVVPTRYLFYPALLAVVLMTCEVFGLLRRRPGLWPVVAVGGVLFWRFLAPALGSLAAGHPQVFVGAVLLGVAAAAAWRWRGTWAPVAVVEAPEDSQQGTALGLALAACLGLAVLATPPNIWSQLERHSVVAPPHRIQDWYRGTPSGMKLPWEMLAEVRERVPGQSVVLAPYDLGHTLPVMSNVYVVTSGAGWSSDLTGFLEAALAAQGQSERLPPGWSHEEERERTRLFHEVLEEGGPVFSSAWTREQSLRFMGDLRVDHLLFPRHDYPELEEWVRRDPHFEIVSERAGWLLARFRP